MLVPSLPIIDCSHKSFPPSSWGMTPDEFLAGEPRLSAFQTPLLTLDDASLRENTRVMAEWAKETGLRLAPHGKTSMSPRLWAMLTDAGAWGLTLATPWQVQVARSFGVTRILLANELVDPVALQWLCAELDGNPDFEFICWADSVDAVAMLERGAANGALSRRLDVVVELGGAGGRTGARSIADALVVADAIAASQHLRVAGVGGYEGALAHGRTPEGVQRVRDYLRSLVDLHRLAEAKGHYEDRRPVLTAGGSAYFDLVADVLAPLTDTATVVLRSGAYQLHDDGYYAETSPFGISNAGVRFEPAISLWARVLSRPEPELAILDAGRRDAPFDEGLPVAQQVLGLGPHKSDALLADSRVEALNDQHTFLRLSRVSAVQGRCRAVGGTKVHASSIQTCCEGTFESNPTLDLHVGDVVRLGISHPCTALDKWRLIPVISSKDAADPHVLDVAATFF